jgi:hypothetical protein
MAVTTKKSSHTHLSAFYSIRFNNDVEQAPPLLVFFSPTHFISCSLSIIVNTRSHSPSLYLSHMHGKLLVHGGEQQAPGPHRVSSKLLVLAAEEHILRCAVDGAGPRPRWTPPPV